MKLISILTAGGLTIALVVAARRTYQNSQPAQLKRLMRAAYRRIS